MWKHQKQGRKKKPSIPESYVRKNRSYATVIAEDRETTRIPPPRPQKQVAPICLSNDSPLRGWIKGKYTLIGVLHSFDHLEKAPYSIKNGDGSRCAIKYLGGLRIAVKFMNDMSREVFMKGWVEWFKEIDSGDIAEFHYERIAWIKISGLPLEMWSEENFNAIVATYGYVVVPFVVEQT